ncbi:hypothetical protein NDU88_007241 [Pleurodeles waltl]|uniref:Uncharacterized protein n=1 Tax=Pleurodeles waltl TaxID=8319 RepID=A0AAV7WCX4_PLEWA|nr:hypothetical protein NDU88_007241 [Pleurodeles waltl]
MASPPPLLTRPQPPPVFLLGSQAEGRRVRLLGCWSEHQESAQQPLGCSLRICGASARLPFNDRPNLLLTSQTRTAKEKEERLLVHWSADPVAQVPSTHQEAEEVKRFSHSPRCLLAARPAIPATQLCTSA